MQQQELPLLIHIIITIITFILYIYILYIFVCLFIYDLLSLLLVLLLLRKQRIKRWYWHWKLRIGSLSKDGNPATNLCNQSARATKWVLGELVCARTAREGCSKIRMDQWSHTTSKLQPSTSWFQSYVAYVSKSSDCTARVLEPRKHPKTYIVCTNVYIYIYIYICTHIITHLYTPSAINPN